MSDFALTALTGDLWAIEESALQKIIDIAQDHKSNPEKLAAFKDSDIFSFSDKLAALSVPNAEPLAPNSRSMVVDDTAIVMLQGPLFKKANLFVRFSGATSTELFISDMQTADANPNINRIIILAESPGGTVSGVNDAAKVVASIAMRKNVIGFADEMCGSGAYWILSQVNRLYASQTALLGSIGVMLRPDMRPDGSIVITSVNAPEKLTDLRTRHGRDYAESVVDKMERIFIESVAIGRNVEVDTVINDFGKGSLLLADDALQAGMVDEVTTFYDLLDANPASSSTREVFNMGNEAQTSITNTVQLAAAYPALVEQIQSKATADAEAKSKIELDKAVAEAVTGERKRVGDILALDEAKDRQVAAMTLASEGVEVSMAKKLLPSMTADAPAPKDKGKDDPKANEQSSFERMMAKHGASPNVGADNVDNNGQMSQAEMEAAFAKAAVQLAGTGH